VATFSADDPTENRTMYLNERYRNVDNQTQRDTDPGLEEFRLFWNITLYVTVSVAVLSLCCGSVYIVCKSAKSTKKKGELKHPRVIPSSKKKARTTENKPVIGQDSITKEKAAGPWAIDIPFDKMIQTPLPPSYSTVSVHSQYDKPPVYFPETAEEAEKKVPIP
ncbi:hypothetical protein PFISCL1PPCAC_6807, partial [Pristionchus fissidentatus]